MTCEMIIRWPVLHHWADMACEMIIRRPLLHHLADMACEIVIRATPPRGKLAADYFADLPFRCYFNRFTEFNTFPSREETHV